MNPNREVSRVIGARLAVGMAMRTKIMRIPPRWPQLHHHSFHHHSFHHHSFHHHSFTIIAFTIIASSSLCAQLHHHSFTIIAFTIIAFMVITAVSLVHKKISWRFAREFTTQKNFLRASREFTTQKKIVKRFRLAISLSVFV